MFIFVRCFLLLSLCFQPLTLVAPVTLSPPSTTPSPKQCYPFINWLLHVYDYLLLFKLLILLQVTAESFKALDFTLISFIFHFCFFFLLDFGFIMFSSNFTFLLCCRCYCGYYFFYFCSYSHFNLASTVLSSSLQLHLFVC